MSALVLAPPQAVEGEIVGNGFFLEANPFRLGDMRYIEGVPDGAPLTAYVEAARAQLHRSYAPYLQVWLGEHRIPEENWARVRPKASVPVYIRVRPQGGKGAGKNILRAVIMIAVIAAAVYFLGPAAFAAGGWIGTSLAVGGAAAAAASAAAIAAVTLVATLALNALIPPPGPSLAMDNKDPRYSLTGTSNRYAPYAPIPRVFGKIKMFPLLAGRPFTEVVGKHQYLRMLLLVGWGPIRVSDIRIGNSPISAFKNTQVEIHEGGPEGWSGNTPITLYNRRVTEQDLTIELLKDQPAPYQTTIANTVEIACDITFPEGIIEYEDDGDRDSRSVIHKFEYRVAGSGGAWTAAPLDAEDSNSKVLSGGRMESTGKTPQVVRHTARWKVPEGQYEVRVTRLTQAGLNPSPNTGDVELDRSFWTVLRSFSSDEAVIQEGVCLIAIRMQATEQLNGVPQTISCIAESYLPVTEDGENWSYEISSSPAWAYADVFRRRGSETYLPDSRVDVAEIMTWADECAAIAPNAAEPRWTFNGVIEGGSVYEAARFIAAIGRASYTLKDGKHSVVRDKEQATPVQHITPKNSWGYGGSRTFPDLPHALRIEFVNKDADYQVDERIVYADGYDETNANKFEVMSLLGCTSESLAWREGRYHLAIGKLRPEEHRVTMDIENLRCTLGDRVQLSHDVISVGRGQGRIDELVTSGADTIGFLLDEEVEFTSGDTFALRVRHADGTTSYRTVTAAGTGFTRSLTCAAEPTATGPQPGDLWAFGVSGIESLPAIVKRIEPGDDLTAMLTLAPYDDAIYTADTGAIPPFFSYIEGDFDRTAPDPPRVTLRSGPSTTEIVNGAVINRLAVDLQPPPSSRQPIIAYEVRYREGGDSEWEPVGGQWAASTTTVWIAPVQVGTLYQVAARVLGANGLFSDWHQPGDHTVAGNGVTAQPMTNITITPTLANNLIEWTNPSSADFLRVDVYRNDEFNFATSTKIGESVDGRFIDSDVYPGDTSHYWLVPVNSVGAGVEVYAGYAQTPSPVVGGGGDNYVYDPGFQEDLWEKSGSFTRNMP